MNMTISHSDDSGDSADGLQRSLGVWAAGAFVVTNMIGTGIFTIPAFVRFSTGSGISALGVWAAGAVLALCGAFCYAELATRMPRVGGEYHYLTRVFGPMWGFLSGWMSFLVGFSAAIAAASIGAVAYLTASLNGWKLQTPLVDGLPITQGALLASGLVILMGLFHARGIRPGGRLQSILAGLTLAAIALLVVLGISSGKGDWSGVTASSGQAAGGNWWVALIEVSFAYAGWNAAAYLAGEVRRPRHTLPWALLGGTLAVALAYLALNILFLFALPADSWERPNIAVAEQASQALFGPSGARFVSALISLAILGSISAMTAAGPRVYFAMARDRLAPRYFGQVHSRSGAPTGAIAAQTAVAAAMALTGAFEALLIYVGSVLLLFNGLTVAAVYVNRRLGLPQSSAFRVPGYPLTPILFLSVVLFAWGQGLITRPLPTLAALLTVVGGMIVYRVGTAQGWLDYGGRRQEKGDGKERGSEA